jgi:hypothetical protein
MSDNSPHFQIGDPNPVGPEAGDFPPIDNEVIEWDQETSSWVIRGVNAVSCMVYNQYSANSETVENVNISGDKNDN